MHLHNAQKPHVSSSLPAAIAACLEMGLDQASWHNHRKMDNISVKPAFQTRATAYWRTALLATRQRTMNKSSL